MPGKNENESDNILRILTIICLIVSCISVGTVGTVLMAAIADLRVETAACLEYAQTMADIRKDEIIEALEE